MCIICEKIQDKKTSFDRDVMVIFLLDIIILQHSIDICMLNEIPFQICSSVYFHKIILLGSSDNNYTLYLIIQFVSQHLRLINKTLDTQKKKSDTQTKSRI